MIEPKVITRAKEAIADGHEGSIIAFSTEVTELVNHIALRAIPGSDSNIPTGWQPLKVFSLPVVDTVEGKQWLVRWKREPENPLPEIRLEGDLSDTACPACKERSNAEDCALCPLCGGDAEVFLYQAKQYERVRKEAEANKAKIKADWANPEIAVEFSHVDADGINDRIGQEFEDLIDEAFDAGYALGSKHAK